MRSSFLETLKYVIQYKEYYSATRKKELQSLVTAWVDLEDIMLIEISQREKDKYRMISFLCGIEGYLHPLPVHSSRENVLKLISPGIVPDQ